MANSQYFKTVVEEHVRHVLSRRYKLAFEKCELRVGTKRNGTAAVHEFDAVALDRSVVAAIKTTTWGENPGAKRQDLFSDLYFLSLIKARVKLLLLTNRETYFGFTKASDGKMPLGVNLQYIRLPLTIQEKVDQHMEKARKEMK